VGADAALAGSTQVDWMRRKVSARIRNSIEPRTANAVRSETGAGGAAGEVAGTAGAETLLSADTMGSR
jgi:hypothetical protein